VGWLSNLLSTPRESRPSEAEQASPSTAFPDYDGQPVAVNPAIHNVRSARELIHDVAVRTAQAYGLPEKWLGFEVVTISNDQNAYFQLQIILKHWDDRLWAHTYAFELAVRKRIREADATTAGAVRAVLWRVEPDAGCPFDDLPQGDWGKPPVLIGDAVAPVTAYQPTQPASAAAAFMAAAPVAANAQFVHSGQDFAQTQPFFASTGEDEPPTSPMLNEDIDWTRVGRVVQPGSGDQGHEDFENTHPVPEITGGKSHLG
jgi:hypothetical protein